MIGKKTSRKKLVLAENCIQNLSLWRKTKRLLQEVFSSSARSCSSLELLRWPISWQNGFLYSLLSPCDCFPANRQPVLQESVVSWVTVMSGTKDNPLLVRHFEISASYSDYQKRPDASWVHHVPSGSHAHCWGEEYQGISCPANSSQSFSLSNAIIKQVEALLLPICNVYARIFH